MRAIRTVNSNFTYLGPTAEIADLPVHRDGMGKVSAVFALTDEERVQISNGAQVRVGIYQEPMPPISIGIVNEDQAPGHEDYRCDQCDGLYVEKRAVRMDYKCGWCGGRLELPEVQS